jgi:hypothetical protein
LKNHQNIIFCIVQIIIEFTNCHPHWTFAIYHDFTLCGHYSLRIFPKDRKASHFCPHGYPFRTYRTIQIWTVIGWYWYCYISCTHKMNVTWYLPMLTMSFISHYMSKSDHISHRCTKFKDITNVTLTKTKTRLSDWLLFIVSSIWSICVMWTIVHTSGLLLIFPIKTESKCNYNLFRKGQQVQMRKMYHKSLISVYI